MVMMPGQALDEYQRLRDTQSQLMDQHKQYGEMLKVKSQQAEKRGEDLDLSDRLLKVFDSNLPKPAREFLLRETAQRMGIDPKGEQFKNLNRMVMGLDPDTMQGMRTMFAGRMKDASPGEIQQTLKAILSGQIDANTLFNQVGAEAKKAQAQQQPGMSGPTANTSEQPKMQDQMSQETEAEPVAPFQDSSSVRSFEEGRVTPAGEEQADPQLVRSLGINANEPIRSNDLLRKGITVPLDRKQQSELALSINTRATGVSATIEDAISMTALFEGKPEVLGLVGRGVRTIQSVGRQAQGLLKMLHGEDSEDLVDLSDNLFKKQIETTAHALMNSHSITKTAENSARIESMVLGLAYRMAIARDIPGNRLTNAIINQHLIQIGQSSSPEQFSAVLQDTVHGLINEFDDSMQRQLGVSGHDILAKRLTDDTIKAYGKNPKMLTPELKAAIHAEGTKRIDIREGKREPDKFEPTHPIDEELETLGKAEMERKELALEKDELSMEHAVAGEERAERSEQLRNEREERLTQSSEAGQSLAREKFDYEKQQDAAKATAAQQAKIGDAFMNFGRAIANSVSGGGGGGGGGRSGSPQNVDAFRITPAPQRTPPRPAGS